ncbi:MAG: peroxiredoxin [Sphingopyxis sp.]
MLREGQAAPDWQLTLADGTALSRGQMAGKAHVLYFYPKADTPGCTNEAKDFSALADDFAAAGVRVIGVSKDKVARLAKFAEKYGLTVTLGSDATESASGGHMTEDFGAWVEKSLYGRHYMGIERCTFLFAADGRLAGQWRKVKVKGHADAVLSAVRAQ